MRDIWSRPWRLPPILWHMLLRGASRGVCPVCDRPTLFYRTGTWLREQLRCARCASIARWRAVMLTLEDRVHDWRDLRIHESSPCGSFSQKLREQCPHYLASHYFPGVRKGDTHRGHRCEDLESQTFADGSFDVVITQDVFEHVLAPAAAFAEIARTLRPGGVHLFTVPWTEQRDTVIRAVRHGDTIRHLAPPVFHANPIDPKGSLVVTDWGRDIVDRIRDHSGMDTTVCSVHEPSSGVWGEQLDVFVSSVP